MCRLPIDLLTTLLFQLVVVFSNAAPMLPSSQGGGHSNKGKAIAGSSTQPILEANHWPEHYQNMEYTSPSHYSPGRMYTPHQLFPQVDEQMQHFQDHYPQSQPSLDEIPVPHQSSHDSSLDHFGNLAMSWSPGALLGEADEHHLAWMPEENFHMHHDGTINAARWDFNTAVNNHQQHQEYYKDYGQQTGLQGFHSSSSSAWPWHDQANVDHSLSNNNQSISWNHGSANVQTDFSTASQFHHHQNDQSTSFDHQASKSYDELPPLPPQYDPHSLHGFNPEPMWGYQEHYHQQQYSDPSAHQMDNPFENPEHDWDLDLDNVSLDTFDLSDQDDHVTSPSKDGHPTWSSHPSYDAIKNAVFKIDELQAELTPTQMQRALELAVKYPPGERLDANLKFKLRHTLRKEGFPLPLRVRQRVDVKDQESIKARRRHIQKLYRERKRQERLQGISVAEGANLETSAYISISPDIVNKLSKEQQEWLQNFYKKYPLDKPLPVMGSYEWRNMTTWLNDLIKKGIPFPKIRKNLTNNV